MNIENINKSHDVSTILICPLDWGLGHATRCIPIIHEFLKQRIKVILATDGATTNLLKKEFPNLTILPLRGYNITYSKSKSSFFFKMLSQIPKILSIIKYEKNWLKVAIREHNIDAVISDNRFGLSNKNIKSIYVTHQLFIQSGNSFLNMLAQKINYKYINQFDECWVPDAEGALNLAGKLSHPKKMPDVPVKYLGPLSRFTKNDVTKENDLLIMLSGPEPQRTVFESILLQQIKTIHQKISFVRGLPSATDVLMSDNKLVTFYNHLPAEELSLLIQRSKLVIARAGYSTVMDLIALQQKAVLVPTPGQTEQEYLSAYLQEQQLFITKDQQNFDLPAAIKEAENFTFKNAGVSSNNLPNIINEFVKELPQKASQ